MRLYKQKKAGFAQPVIDFYATVIIVLILIIFFILFWLHTNEIHVKISQQAGAADANIMLHNLLRVTIDDNGEKMPLAEYLDRIKDPRMQNTYNPMQQPVRVYLQALSDSSGCPYRLSISIDNNQLKEIVMGNGVKDSCKKNHIFYQAKQLIPSMTGKTIIAELTGGVK